MLDAEPRNREAVNGLRTLFDFYRHKADSAASDGDFAGAHEYLDRALDVAPDSEARAAVRFEIERLGG